MIEEQATVVAASGDFAEVVATRHSACGGCSAKSGCGTSLIADWFPQRQLTFRLRNRVGAAPGDTVVVGLDEQFLQKGSLLLYALPLSGLLLGAIAGENFFIYFGWSSELGAILTGLLGLIVSLIFVRRHSVRGQRTGEAGVKLLRVVRSLPSVAAIDLDPSTSQTHIKTRE